MRQLANQVRTRDSVTHNVSHRCKPIVWLLHPCRPWLCATVCTQFIRGTIRRLQGRVPCTVQPSSVAFNPFLKWYRSSETGATDCARTHTTPWGFCDACWVFYIHHNKVRRSRKRLGHFHRFHAAWEHQRSVCHGLEDFSTRASLI